MALLKKAFAPSETKSASFDIIPAGWYEAEITGSELKTTKAGDGTYIAVKFKIIEESHEGRLVWTNLNMENKSETAVRIGHSDLKSICEAVGFEGELEDTEDLHNIPLMVKLVVKPASAQWPEKNEVKGYSEV